MELQFNDKNTKVKAPSTPEMQNFTSSRMIRNRRCGKCDKSTKIEKQIPDATNLELMLL